MNNHYHITNVVIILSMHKNLKTKLFKRLLTKNNLCLANSVSAILEQSARHHKLKGSNPGGTRRCVCVCVCVCVCLCMNVYIRKTFLTWRDI
jgi:hypothetical protein